MNLSHKILKTNPYIDVFGTLDVVLKNIMKKIVRTVSENIKKLRLRSVE